MKTLVCKALILFTSILIISFTNSCEKVESQRNPVTEYIEYDGNNGEIGPGGGTIILDESPSFLQGAKLYIPQGALDEIVTITISLDNSIRPVCDTISDIIRLEPDGIRFNKPVSIEIPIDTSIHHPRFFTFNNDSSILKRLPISIYNKEEKYISVELEHFSKYVLGWPSKLTDYYYDNRNTGYKKIYVPFYLQDGEWCFYYSLSMLLKNSGFSHKAPYLASMLGERNNENWVFRPFQFGELPIELLKKGITTEIQFLWTNVTNLCGYIMYQLDNGRAIQIGSNEINHSFIVTGHDRAGFFINDPSNVTGNLDISPVMKHIPYHEFEELFDRDLLSTETTIYITNMGSASRYGLTLNFHEDTDNIWITEDPDDRRSAKGMLELNGKYKPNGYSLVNSDSETATINGADYLFINPLIANSYDEDIPFNLHFKIDGKDISGSPIHYITKSHNYGRSYDTKMSTQLSNLQKGLHIVDVELRSANSVILYDSWTFDLEITNEYTVNLRPNQPINIVPGLGAMNVSTSPTLEWSCTDPENDKLVYDIYCGPTNPPEIKVGSRHPSTEVNLSGLANNTKYYWVVIAADDHGLPTTGPVWSFTTSNSIVEPTVLTSDITNFTQTSALVGGQISNNGGSSIDEKGVYWGNSVNPQYSGSKMILGSGNGAFSGTLSGLTPNTKYYVVAYGSNSHGTGFGNQEYFKTPGESETVTDYDGNIYETIKIGDQWWMAENLASSKFSDGTALTLAEADSEWSALPLDTPAYCWMNNDKDSDGELYGALYNQAAVTEGNLCPDGWHVPSDEDWKILELFLGLDESLLNASGERGETIGTILKSTSGWMEGSNGTDDYGFNALPAGSRDGFNGLYYLTNSTSWRSADGKFRRLATSSGIYRYQGNWDAGYSVRCVKD